MKNLVKLKNKHLQTAREYTKSEHWNEHSAEWHLSRVFLPAIRDEAQLWGVCYLNPDYWKQCSGNKLSGWGDMLRSQVVNFLSF